MSSRSNLLCSLATLALAACSVAASAQVSLAVTRTIPIGGEGGWDYLTVDPANHHLFVPRSTHTQVIDPESGKVIADIPGQKSAHGVALVPELNRGFITDGGGTGAIIIFDLKTFATIGKFTTLPDTDGIIYDAGLHRVLTVSGDEGKLMTFAPEIDPAHPKVDTIALGGKPEFLATDENGKAYINLEDKSTVAVVDVKASKVLAHWPVAPGGDPVGMAIDRENHRLIIGCRKPQKMVIMSTADGKILGSVPIGAGVDATVYALGYALASCRDGSLTFAHDDGGSFSVIQTLKTPLGARTMGLDADTHTLYLPTAEYEAPAPGAAATARPKMKPNSFMIVVVQPQQ